ncbi:MAG: M4 family metallopeptidase [Thermoanaerobaculaceae bacterium]|nr:M4 family metallopeptidase [Thermoanaerobaculaceae bacterium]MDI9621845.1 M4 family metallopeptidase [Acidobacteriota bacterium]NLH11055.1 hypothetical protein [Holophagae bacterium]HPW54440.1 M4 family metallopeptidase [Thermoanaerobaculaceae bacterium]
MKWVAGSVMTAVLALIGWFALAAGTGKPSTQLSGDEQLQVLASLPSVGAVAVDSDGTPTFVTGTLGYLGRGSVESAAIGFARRVGPLYHADGSEELVAVRTIRDELGQVHVKLQQHHFGLEVEGAEICIHADEKSGVIHALNGRFFPTNGLPREPWVGAEEALTDAAIEAGILASQRFDHPHLTYVVQNAKVYLAWTAEIEHVAGDMPIVDQVYADAMGSGLIAARAVALSRRIHNANHTLTLPGALMLWAGGSSSDLDAMGAYNLAGTPHAHPSARQGRASFNGSAAFSANPWRIGETCWTPGTSDAALRSMDNPTLDGSSKDFYPERDYPSGCTPSNSNDYCGVHTNSGIANLAYYLLVSGGTHPRGKTTVNVPAIGIAKAQKIFYRALTCGYMTSLSSFQDARNATAQAATDLFTATEVDAVHKCWDAVGVPGGAMAVTVLPEGQIVSNLSGASGSWAYFKIAVPASQTQLAIKIFNGTGDCDLYVKHGAIPTFSSHDFRPYLSGNNETVTVSNPVSGDWFIGLYGYSAFSAMSLQATYTGLTPSFALDVSPTTLRIVKGSSGCLTVTTTVDGGFSSTVSLSALAVPSGATATFDPIWIPVPGSGTSTMTINTGAAVTGAYTVAVSATGGGLTKTATVALTIADSGGTEIEPNNTTSTANKISTSGVQLGGCIASPTDIDFFEVSLPAGQTLTCEMWPPSTTDYDVAFYNPSGTKLASGTEGAGCKETVTFKNSSSSTMTVYIKCFGHNGAYSPTLTYTIKFTW